MVGIIEGLCCTSNWLSTSCQCAASCSPDCFQIVGRVLALVLESSYSYDFT